jgi:hypothetical protein
MSSVSHDAAVGVERAQLHRLARANPGVVHLGWLTGQLALYFDPPEAGVSRVAVTAVVVPAPADRHADYERYFHAVVRRVGRVVGDGRRRVFRHPAPAVEWLFETVTDFDVLETVCVNEPAGGEPE